MAGLVPKFSSPELHAPKRRKIEPVKAPILSPSEGNPLDRLKASIRHHFAENGIKSLHPWQRDALRDLMSGKNLLVTCPTASGKSFLAQVFALFSFMGSNPFGPKIEAEMPKGCKILIALPFKALVRQTTDALKKICRHLQFDVHDYQGGIGMFPIVKGRICIVATYEKAGAVLSSLIAEERTDELIAVVIDEVHLILDEKRGIVVELLITKLLQWFGHVRMLGITATLESSDVLAKWMGAKHMNHVDRPFTLFEKMVRCKDKLAWKILDASDGERVLVALPFNDLRIETQYGEKLTIEMVVERLVKCSMQEGKTVLVFCPTKKKTVEMKEKLSKSMKGILSSHMDSSQMDALSADLGDLGSSDVHHGCVAYHHADVPNEARQRIELALANGTIKVACCTPTLAAGVDFPVDRVIIMGTKTGTSDIQCSMYRQMTGRAGRKSDGDSFLVVKNAEEFEIAKRMASGPLPTVESTINSNATTLEIQLPRVLLEAAVLGADPSNYIKQTLAYCSAIEADRQKLLEVVHTEVVKLQGHGLLDSNGRATPFGIATQRSNMTIEDSKLFLSDIKDIQMVKCDLSMALMIAPLRGIVRLSRSNWIKLSGLIDDSDSLARLYDVDPVSFGAVLSKGVNGDLKDDYCPHIQRFCARLFCAYILDHLSKFDDMSIICKKFEVTPGYVERIINESSTLGYTLVNFCTAFGWTWLIGGVQKYCEEMLVGVPPEARELFQIPNMTRKRARALFKLGYYTIKSIAEESVLALQQVCKSFSEYPARAAKSLQKNAMDSL